MTEQELELQAVEASLEDTKQYLEFSRSEERLADNADFKTLILEGYFKDEAARLTGILADPNMQDEINQREIFSALKAISHLRQYLMHVRRTRNSIEASLQETEEYAEELRNGEV